MKIGNTEYDHACDDNGNMRFETTSRHFEWNHADQMKAFRTQTEGAEPTVHAHYFYDAEGRRLKKLVRTQGGQVEVTHYIDGIFEHHRWGAGPQASENNHVHVLDDKQRIALMRVGPGHPDDRGPAVQFHLCDHLGSSNVIIDESTAFINREEFTPYGETTFGSFARKRYRFTGQEQDEESGLNHHGARYYAPWLGRWANSDPAGIAGGYNLFAYAFDNPVMLADPLGTQPAEEPIFVGYETIYVTGTAPPDVYGSAVAGGFSRVLPTEEEHKGNLASENNSRLYDWTLEGQNQRFEWQWNREEAQARWDKHARSEFEHFSTLKIAELKKQQRLMGAANRFWWVALVGSALGAAGAFAPAADLVVVGTSTGAGTEAGITASVIHTVTFWQHMSRDVAPDASHDPNASAIGANRRLDQARGTAREGAITDALESLRSGSPTPQASYFRDSLEAEYGREAVVEFMDTGELPRGIDFSHLFSAAEYPEFAHRSELGVLVDATEHRLGHHGGNTSIPLHGIPRGRR